MSNTPQNSRGIMFCPKYFAKHLCHNEDDGVAHLIVYNAMMMVMTKKNIMVIMKMMEMMMMKMEMMMKLQRGAVVTMVRPIHICPGYRPPAHSHQKGMNILWICHFVKKHL